MSFIILFQLTFTFIYNNFSNKFSVYQNKWYPNKFLILKKKRMNSTFLLIYFYRYNICKEIESKSRRFISGF